jgi:putative ABC transport system ATP-binding protein
MISFEYPLEYVYPVCHPFKESRLLNIHQLQRPGLGPIDLEVPPGTCACISGPSGAGKSLMLRAIADLDPNTGTLVLDGMDRNQMSAPEWRRHVGYVPAEPAWWETVPANHFMDVAGVTEITARLGLSLDNLHQTIDTLSTGERQRLALARALELNPDVLMLDEPTSALDEDSTERVEQEVRNLLDRGVAVIMVTHNEAQIARLATARYAMQPGGTFL